MHGYVKDIFSNELRTLACGRSKVRENGRGCYWDILGKFENMPMYRQQNQESNCFLYYEVSSKRIILSKTFFGTLLLIGELYAKNYENFELIFRFLVVEKEHNLIIKSYHIFLFSKNILFINENLHFCLL